MTDALAPIVTKLATFVRLLSSDKEGEIVAAAHAIKRTLKSAGTDIHTLAERIEKPNGIGLTEAEMKKLYDAGFSAGMREAENRRYGSADFHNVGRSCTTPASVPACARRRTVATGRPTSTTSTARRIGTRSRSFASSTMTG